MSYMHIFSIFVFALVQRNWACFTWKGPLEICSLLLLSLLSVPLCVCSPTPDVYWERTDGAPLPDRAKIKSFGQELMIENLDFDDAGTYECWATNTNTQTREQRTMSIRVECKSLACRNSFVLANLCLWEYVFLSLKCDFSWPPPPPKYEKASMTESPQLSNFVCPDTVSVQRLSPLCIVSMTTLKTISSSFLSFLEITFGSVFPLP